MQAFRRRLANSFSRGFTLVEVLVVIVIFSLLAVVVGRFLVVFFNLKYHAETVQRLRQEGNAALDQIDYLVRSSLTLPDICVGRIPPKNPPGSFSLHQNLKAIKVKSDGSSTIECDPKSEKELKSAIYKNPIHCEFDPTISSKYNSSFKVSSSICQDQCSVYQQLRTNTQGETDGAYFVRNLVALADCSSDPTGKCVAASDQESSLYLWRSFNADAKHNKFDDFIGNTNVKYSSLTNFRSEPGGSPFKVSNLAFYCFFDYFSNSYVVSTSFEISYERQALSGRAQKTAQPISEKFYRYSVVRNPYPFEY